MTKVSLPSIWLLAAIAFVSPFAMNVFNPAMPYVVNDLQAQKEIVQLTLTLYLFTLGLSQLFSGTIADYFGRRPVILGGMIIQLAGTLLAATAASIDVLIIARILQAVGGGATTVLVRTIILDVVDRNEGGKFLSYVSMTIAIAQIVAPTIGGYLNFYFDWRAIFYCSFILNILIVVTIFYQLNETAKPSKQARSIKLPSLLSHYWSACNSPVYLGYVLCGAFSTCAYLSFASIMPYIFIDSMNGTSASYGNWFLIVSLGYFLGSFLAARLTTRFGIDYMIYSGLLLAFCTALLTLFLTSQNILVAALIFIPMGVLTFGRGLLYPNTQSGALSSVEINRGTASGMLAFIQLLLATIFTQCMPFILNLGVAYVFAVIVFLIVLASASHQFALYNQNRKQAI